MTMFEIAQKVAELLKGRTIYFDFKSYDNEEDIPHIFDGFTRCNVSCVRFSEDGSFFEVLCDNYACRVDVTEDGVDIMDENELYELLSNIYYETDESHIIGDFETEFLDIPWWDLSK